MIDRIRNNVFARNSTILFGGTMLANILNYIFHFMIGRMLSVEIYGEAESLISLINIISIPVITLTLVATKYSAHCKADNDKITNLEIMKYLNKKILVYGLPIFFLTIVFTPFIGRFLNIEDNTPLIFVWVLILLSVFGAINSGILVGWQKFKDVSLLNILGAATKLIAGAILIITGFALSGVIGSFILGGIVSYLTSVVALRFIITSEHKKSHYNIHAPMIQSMKNYVIPAFIATLAINILGNIDMFLAKHNLDPITAGQYGALTTTSKMIFFATGIIATVLFPMSAEDNYKKVSSTPIFKNAVYFMLIASLLAIVIYFVFPHFILSLLFGSKYAEVAGFLGWFAIVATLFSFVNFILQYLLSIHKTKIVWGLLVMSIVTSLTILFFGRDISTILKIISLSQIVAVLMGLFFLLHQDTKSDHFQEVTE